MSRTIRRMLGFMPRGLLGATAIAFLVACAEDEPVTGPRTVASVAVTPPTSAIVIGETVSLAATAKDASGSVIVGRALQWTTSNASIATVSSAGVVLAVAQGIATISATIDGKSGSAAITVSPVSVASVRLTPTTVVLERNATRQLTAVAVDAAGSPLDGRAVQRSTDAPTVATVSTTGMVQAVGTGYAVIRATVEGRSASSAITVVEPEERFDLVYERRPFNGNGDIRRISLASGVHVVLPLALTVEGTIVRDVTPSPDGTRFAFTVAWYPPGQPDLDGDIYIANIDGSGMRRLTSSPELDDEPAWSPDGTRIAYRSRQSGNPDIWVIGVNGTGARNLMTDILPATSVEATPTWSADGTRIVFSSDLDHFSIGKLWTMRADGTDKRRLLPQSVGTIDIDREPSWSPDGSRIAFRRSAPTAVGSDIMILNVATGALTRITMPGEQTHPAWSPDGARIAFSSGHEELLAHVYTMKPNGTDVTRYTTGVDENTYPQWIRVMPASAPARSQ